MTIFQYHTTCYVLFKDDTLAPFIVVSGVEAHYERGAQGAGAITVMHRRIRLCGLRSY